jgi:DNA-binding LytR/AlgR family response regulator
MKSEHSAGQITVVVADDHPVIREGLVKILESAKDIKIVAEAEDGEEVCVCSMTGFVLMSWSSIFGCQRRMAYKSFTS